MAVSRTGVGTGASVTARRSACSGDRHRRAPGGPALRNGSSRAQYKARRRAARLTKPPSPLHHRRPPLEGFGGNKASSCAATSATPHHRDRPGATRPSSAFHASARSKDSASMVDPPRSTSSAAPVIIPMTPKMRRFLFALLRQAGKEPTGGSGRGVIVVQVPAAFLRPRSTSSRGRPSLPRACRRIWGLVP